MGTAAESFASGDQPGIETDESSWPILQVTPPATVTDGMLAAYLDWYRTVDERRGPHAIVMDLRGSQGITTEQRRMMLSRMEERGGRTSCLGLAMVFESKVLRAILTAMFWVRSPPYPTRVFADRESAFGWCRGLLSPGAGRPEPSVGWLVQGTARVQPDAAQRCVDRMAQLGQPARVEEKVALGRVMHVPVVGPFSDRDSAVRVKDRLAATGLDCSILPVGEV